MMKQGYEMANCMGLRSFRSLPTADPLIEKQVLHAILLKVVQDDNTLDLTLSRLHMQIK